MLRLHDIKLPLDHAADALRAAVIERLGIDAAELLSLEVFKRSYDARNKSAIQLIYHLDVTLADAVEQRVLQRAQERRVQRSPDMQYRFLGRAGDDFPRAGQQRPIVIGFGPCGILAALLLAQMGLRPIVLERGKDVRRRTRDTWGLWRRRELDTESNVQFGEGGAGTFSDGKLYSQVKDRRHLGRKVLEEFVKAGAPEEILYLGKPHIGAFKLVTMVEKLRAEIVRLGGEIRFGEKVDALLLDAVDTQAGVHANVDAGMQRASCVRGVVTGNGETLYSRHVVLAIGHSARDTFQRLFEQGVYIEAKPFSIGFRIEHPQSVIDRARFGNFAGHPLLGAADYKLVHHCRNGRSVYSFCMCPGGTVVAATSEEGRVVTNGMSQYSRNERNANSAIVVGISPEVDFPHHPLAGIDLQRELESRAFVLGGGNYNAPAQLLGDFLAGRPSAEFGSVIPSYQPGVTLADLTAALPAYAVEAIREALPVFDRQIKGFAMPDAVLTAVETRSSSPICIRRGEDLQSVNTAGLYPAGEGAGYAGGILSAAIDGIKVAEAVATSLLGVAQA